MRIPVCSSSLIAGLALLLAPGFGSRAHAFQVSPQIMGAYVLGQGIDGKDLSGFEGDFSLLVQPDSDRWIFLGPRVSVFRSSQKPVSGTEVYYGAEGTLWIVNAIGPGLAADLGPDSEWRVEPFLSVRIKRVGQRSAVALRVAPLYDSRLQWLFKGGLTFQLGGVD